MERADTSDIRGASEGTKILIMLFHETTKENGALIKILKRKATLKEQDLGGDRLNISRFSWIC